MIGQKLKELSHHLAHGNLLGHDDPPVILLGNGVFVMEDDEVLHVETR